METKIQVKVIPNGSKNKVESWKDGLLRVRLTAVPEKGKANDALVALLAETFQIPKSQIRIVSGHTGKIKWVAIMNLSEEQLQQALHRIQP